VRFFEDAGGVAGIGRTDRMGCLGSTRGRTFRFVPEAMHFAAAHGFAFKACAARDAKRKGKVERPFRELNEAFMQELVVTGPPSSIQELNARATAWLTTQVHTRPHRVTGVPPAQRLETERGLLAPLPRIRYDTARVQPRRVGAPVPLVELDGVPYSAPPSLAGTMVEVRVPVDVGVVEIRGQGGVGGHPPPGPAGRGDALALRVSGGKCAKTAGNTSTNKPRTAQLSRQRRTKRLSGDLSSPSEGSVLLVEASRDPCGRPQAPLVAVPSRLTSSNQALEEAQRAWPAANAGRRDSERLIPASTNREGDR
jgi:hypothetical protein